MRSVEEIRADLATEEGRGAMERRSPIGRLVADVPALLVEREDREKRIEELTATVDELRAAMGIDDASLADDRNDDAWLEGRELL